MELAKVLGGFLIGAAVGAAASYIFLKDKYEKSADEEIKLVKEYYRKKYDELDNRVEKVKKQGSEIKELQKKVVESVVKYNTFSNADPEENYNVAVHEHPTEDDGVYEISFDEYLNDNPMDEKKELIYYAGDQTLVDEAGEPIEIDGTIGYDCIAILEDSINNIAYFRNPKNETDYEVDKVDGAYKDLIGDI